MECFAIVEIIAIVLIPLPILRHQNCVILYPRLSNAPLISRLAVQPSPIPGFTWASVSARNHSCYSSLAEWPFGQHSCAASWRQSSDTSEITYLLLH